MISRLTAFAATFAVLATATLAFAASAPSHDTGVTSIAGVAKAAANQPMKVIQLERVVVTGKRVFAIAR